MRARGARIRDLFRPWKSEIYIRAKRLLSSSWEEVSIGSCFGLRTMEEILRLGRFNLELETSECGGLRRVHSLVTRGGCHNGGAVVYTHLE